MQEWNEKNYDVNGRPDIPPIRYADKNTLAWCALTFLRENCEDLRFDPTAGGECETKTDKKNVIDVKDNVGKSYCNNQIPYHMQMDIDRLCLERTLGDFLAPEDGGTTQKAYLVYFCYLEMYWGKDSAKARKMIELLSAFEQNASPLLRKHRDHFVHSVYVFAMGLAIYQQSETYRRDYMVRNHFTPDRERDAAHHFLKYWGFTALLHDLGYPFELVVRQIDSCFEKQSIPPLFVVYQDQMKKDEKKKEASKEERAEKPEDNPTAERTEEPAEEPIEKPTDKPVDKQEENRYAPLYRALLSELFLPKNPNLVTVNELFAGALAERLFDGICDCPDYEKYWEKGGEKTKSTYYSYLKDYLDGKLTDSKYMDHAYFSAYMLLHQLWSPGQAFPEDYLDALTAILLHNSLFKYAIMKHVEIRTAYPKMSSKVHPLAYLLMLCDELQCWDRTGYGKKTRRENHPIGCDLTIKGNEITATYRFDKECSSSRIKNTGTYVEICDGNFIKNLEAILDIDSEDALSLTVIPKFSERRTGKGDTLSHSSFLDLYQVATILNAEYRTRGGSYTDYHESEPRNDDTFTEEKRMEYFDQLSLEYKLSNLYQVQCYAEILEKYGMFFTDRQVAYEEVKKFDDNILAELGRLKHEAWAKEKRAMGWLSGEDYLKKNKKNKSKQNNMRERLRMHQYIDLPFNKLEGRQKKDTEPIDQQRKIMLNRFNIRVYILPKVEQIPSHEPVGVKPAPDPAPADAT